MNVEQQAWYLIEQADFLIMVCKVVIVFASIVAVIMGGYIINEFRKIVFG